MSVQGEQIVSTDREITVVPVPRAITAVPVLSAIEGRMESAKVGSRDECTSDSGVFRGG